MLNLRNNPGALAVIVPCEEAADDIKAHGGKVVTTVSYKLCGLGGYAWETEPTYADA